MSKIVALSAGDPSSISSLISLKAWLKLKDTEHTFVFCGNQKNIDEVIKLFDLSIETKTISWEALKNKEEVLRLFKKFFLIINIDKKIFSQLGSPNFNNADYILRSLNMTVELAKKSLVSAIITNPIDKFLINQYLLSQNSKTTFLGHTSYLSEISNQKPTTMMLATNESKLKVVPITTHVSLQEVPQSLNTDLIIKKTTDAHLFLKKYCVVENPQIAILALNPHAGENGLMGEEEITIINPAIEQLKNLGINVKGPFPADSFFNQENLNNYDVVMGMYHDQVLTPFKLLHFHSGVNVTIGLDFIRTSPDHGVGFDIATTQKASEESLVSAIKMAHTLAIN